MPHHFHHQHKAQNVERDMAVETVVSVVWVSANPLDGVNFGLYSTPEPTPTVRQNGQPLRNTRQDTQVTPTSATYSAPNRQMRPYTDQTNPEEAAATYVASSVTSAAHPTGKAVQAPPAQSSPTTLYPSYISQDITTGIAANTYTAPAKPTIAESSESTSGNNITKANTSNGGISVGALAGIVVAIVLGIALLAGLGFCLVRRKKSQKNQEHQRLDDEKSALRNRSQSVSSHVSVRRSKTNAPRLSLRPVTQMFPGQQMSEKQDNNGLAPAAGFAARSRTPEPASQNPFGDNNDEKSVLTTPLAAAAPTPVTAKLDQMAQDSPRSESSAFPVAPAGSRRNSPPGPGQNNVHRVQLDFKPSMDDELELRAGSLVRMLHEYDDGWALCIRLDRSQQGVVPRTCISKLPVKPRPSPPGPNMRSGTPTGPNQPQSRPRAGSNSSSGSNPRIPPGAANTRPRPPPGARIRAQSNAPRRPQSPAQYARGPGPQNGYGNAYGNGSARPRANSDAMSARRITPPSPMASSPSPMSSAPSSPPQGQGQGQGFQAQVPARKPVPGQAL